MITNKVNQVCEDRNEIALHTFKEPHLRLVKALAARRNRWNALQEVTQDQVLWGSVAYTKVGFYTP